MKSFRFDFNKGDFDMIDGKCQVVEDNELIKNAVEKLIRTELDKYPIYSGSEYGMPFHGWIYTQRDRELITIALSRELSERIPELIAGVKRVYDIDLAFDRRKVTVRFSVATEYTEKEEFETWAAF